MPPPPPVDKLLTRQEVAELLRTCGRTVQRLTLDGKLPCLRFNSRLLRYKLSDVQTYLDSIQQ